MKTERMNSNKNEGRQARKDKKKISKSEIHSMVLNSTQFNTDSSYSLAAVVLILCYFANWKMHVRKAKKKKKTYNMRNVRIKRCDEYIIRFSWLFFLLPTLSTKREWIRYFHLFPLYIFFLLLVYAVRKPERWAKYATPHWNT